MYEWIKKAEDLFNNNDPMKLWTSKEEAQIRFYSDRINHLERIKELQAQTLLSFVENHFTEG